MIKIKSILATLLLTISLITPFVAIPVYAASALDGIDTKQQACEGTGGHLDKDRNCVTANKTDLTSLIANIISVLLFIIGAVAVIMIIIGAFRFVLSAGDPAAAKSARNTILYAVVGLVIALAAYAIVKFVINNFAKG